MQNLLPVMCQQQALLIAVFRSHLVFRLHNNSALACNTGPALEPLVLQTVEADSGTVKARALFSRSPLDQWGQWKEQRQVIRLAEQGRNG